MRIFLDQEASYTLYAEIIKRALLDTSDHTTSTPHRDDAITFLDIHCPEWRHRWRPKPRKKWPSGPRNKMLSQNNKS